MELCDEFQRLSRSKARQVLLNNANFFHTYVPISRQPSIWQTTACLAMILGGRSRAMAPVEREIRRDIESKQLWALEVFQHEIVGCLGPFATDAMVPRYLDGMTFERNGELLRWLSGKDLQR